MSIVEVKPGVQVNCRYVVSTVLHRGKQFADRVDGSISENDSTLVITLVNDRTPVHAHGVYSDMVKLQKTIQSMSGYKQR